MYVTKKQRGASATAVAAAAGEYRSNLAYGGRHGRRGAHQAAISAAYGVMV